MEKQPSNTPEKAFSHPLNVYRLENFDDLEQIRFIGDAKEIDMGETYRVKKDEFTNVFSYGANPCISGIIISQSNQTYCFHSDGPLLTLEQESLIKTAKKGIVGGGVETLLSYEELFKNKNIEVIAPLESGQDFNYVLLKSKNEFNTPPGFYFTYDNFDLE